MSLTPATNRQIPDNSIMDAYNKQTYLGNAFVISTDLVSTTTQETPLLVLSNPASNFNQNGQSGNLSLFQLVRKLQCDTLGAGVVFKIYVNPTGVSGGTTLTPNNLRPATGIVSKMTAKLSPTVVSKGIYVATFTPNLVEIDSSVLYILDPGYSILITVLAAETSNAAAEISWYEI